MLGEGVTEANFEPPALLDQVMHGACTRELEGGARCATRVPSGTSAGEMAAAGWETWATHFHLRGTEDPRFSWAADGDWANCPAHAMGFQKRRGTP